jgi:hypothetical protein
LNELLNLNLKRIRKAVRMLFAGILRTVLRLQFSA